MLHFCCYREVFRESFSAKVVLILHDVDDKETRRGYQEDFKKGKIDLLVVFNMLLTGFDAPRLKKQYLGRLIKEHILTCPFGRSTP